MNLTIFGATGRTGRHLVEQALAAGHQVSAGTAHILAAMAQHGVRRLVISAGAGVPDPRDRPRLSNRLIGWLLKRLSRHVYEDMARTVALVRASELAWTVVRVPMLTDDPPSGAVRAAYVGQGMGFRLSRADLAAFMLEEATAGRHIQQAPAISH